MKIADVSEFYAEQGGGVRTYTHQKFEAASRAGVDLTVIAPGPEDRIEPRKGGRIVWVKSYPMPLDPRYFMLLRQSAVHQILHDTAPDVVEGSSTWTAGWFVARWPGHASKALVFHQDPVAVYPHTALDRWVERGKIDEWCAPYWNYLKRLSVHYDATVVAGAWLAARLAGFDVQRPVAVPFGINKSELSPLRRSVNVRRKLLAKCGHHDDVPLLVGISRHHPEKRLGTIIEAFRRARAHRQGRLAFVLFGDGPLRPWVRRLARRVDGLHVAGYTRNRDELAQALASSDAFLHGSAAETFGLVVGEAICSGLPLIVPDAGGASDLADPAWAEVYRPGDVQACAHAIQRLLARDRTALNDATTSAAKHRVLSIDEHFATLFETYEKLANR